MADVYETVTKQMELVSLRFRRDVVPSGILLLMFVLGWEVACRLLQIHKVVLPSPSLIGSTLWQSRGSLLSHMGFTFKEVLLGFGLGFVSGLGLAVVIVYSPTLEKAVYPLVVASQTIPVFAIAPLLVIWFGFGILPKVLVAALVVFFPICVNEVEGLRSAEPEVIDLLRSLSVSRWKIFRLVQFPASLPYLIAGTQVGIAYSVIGAVIGEWVGSAKGIGYLMLAANAMVRTDLVFASIIVLSVVALALFGGVALVARVLMPWKHI